MESVGIRPSVAAPPPPQLTPEEEALKRNTDCVYFLASPLTCKKGSECEYRHSEGARVNPRDCYYWLHGNCMNPKCAFRHPPLDGLFGAPPTPAVPQVTASNKVAASNKAVPCYYFQKGNCLKGDRCPFMHGPALSVSNSPQKVSPSPQLPQKKDPSEQPIIPQKVNPSTKFSTNNKVINNNLVSNFAKPVSNLNKPNEAPAVTPKSLPKAEITVKNNNNGHQLVNKPMLVNNNNYRNNNNISSDDELQEYPNNQFTVSRGAQVQNRERLYKPDERAQDSRDGDEFLGESSPGFDVIVDHDEDDSRYLPHNEEDHHLRRAYDGYDPTAEMYPLDHDYELMPRYDYERDRYAVLPEQDYQPEFDPYERKRPRRESSHERDLDRPSRRRSHRDEIESNVDGSDLRFRLMSKQRRLNGSRPEISPDKRDHRREDRSHRHRRDEKRDERHVSRDHVDRVDLIARGTRLQGRIKIPERRPDLMHLEMERDRRRHFRVSPVRHREIMRPRSSEVGRPGFRRSEEDIANFAGPKSLKELKSGKTMSEKGGEGRGRDQESSLDFEGPKPLSVILKRKREAAGNGSSFENKIHDVSTPKEDQVRDTAGGEEEEEGMILEGDGTDIKETEVNGIDEEVEEPYDLNYYEVEGEEEYKMEEGQDYIEEGEEVNEEYQEGGEGDVNEEYQEEGGEEEYQEGGNQEYEDDEDDFARKVGVIIS